MPATNLQGYMSSAIRRIMAKAYRNVLSNPREAKTVFRLQNTFIKSESRRKAVAKESGVEVPPFLICSISTECNLSCKGCYARANGIAVMPYVNRKKCIGCGTCEKVCPIGNIRLIENVQTNQRVARIGQECTNCLSCVHFCPQQALELNGRETDKSYQYHHPGVSVKDILKARENRD